MHVVLGGDTKPEKFLVSHYIAFFRKIKRDFEQALRNLGDTYPEPVDLCDVCGWLPLCYKRRRDDDHLSLVAGITKLQRKELGSRELDTVARLANLTLPPVPDFDRIGDAALLRIREQARVQVRGRTEERIVYELLEPIEELRGLAALPLPSPGDIFLDFEAVPYAFDTGLEHLIGTALMPEQPGVEPRYESLWSFEPSAEKKAFEQFIATVIDRWKRYPDLHIYHPRSCRQRTRHRSGPGSARDAVASVVGKSRRNIEHKFARGISHFSCGVDIRMVRPQVLMRVVTEGADSVSFSQYDQNILATIRRVIHPSS
jgi:uncharacterized protein